MAKIEVRETPAFERWLLDLRDVVGRRRILQRLARLELGLFGDVKPLGGKLHELRITHGPGYRIYYTYRGEMVVLLLCGGDKVSQSRDIGRARAMIDDME